MEDLPPVPCIDPRIAFLRSLPTVPLSDVKYDDGCAICLMSFDAICAEPPEQFELGEDDLIELHGLTKLARCGHIFCKKDLVEWVNTSHGSCPTCRDVFLEIPKEEDVESSDGGEYIPDEDDLMRSDDFMTDDGEGEGEDDDVVTTDEDMSDWGEATEEDDYSFSSDPATGDDDDADMSDSPDNRDAACAPTDC